MWVKRPPHLISLHPVIGGTLVGHKIDAKMPLQNHWSIVKHSLHQISDVFPARVPSMGIFPHRWEATRSHEGSREHLGPSRNKGARAAQGEQEAPNW